MFGSFGTQELLMLMLLCLPGALMIWALVDCVKRDFPGPNDKLIWVLIVVLVGCAGPLLYLVIGQPKGTLEPPPGY